MENKEKQDPFRNTVLKCYPTYYKKRILKQASEAGFLILSHKSNNNLRDLPDVIDVSSFETVDEKLDQILNSSAIREMIENMKYSKQYRMFAYFSLDELDSNHLSSVLNSDKVISAKDVSLCDCSALDDVITYSFDGTNLSLKFEFLLKDSENGVEIQYPVLAYVDLANAILEIRLDPISINYKRSYDYYKDTIIIVRNRISNLLNCSVKDIDFRAVFDFLKYEDADLDIYAQKMTRNKTSAYLESFEEEDIVIPILGELQNLMACNKELFCENDSTKKIKSLLEKFIKKIEIDSDIPQLKVRFEELNAKVGITHNYKGAQFSLFRYYEDLKKTREVVDNVRRYFVQAYKKLGEPTSTQSVSNEPTL